MPERALDNEPSSKWRQLLARRTLVGLSTILAGYGTELCGVFLLYSAHTNATHATDATSSFWQVCFLFSIGLFYRGMDSLITWRHLARNEHLYRLAKYVHRLRVLLFASALFLYPFGGALLNAFDQWLSLPSWATHIVAGLEGAAPSYLVIGGCVISWLLARITAPSATELMQLDPRPPVVLLRPFGLDQSKLKGMARRRGWKGIFLHFWASGTWRQFWPRSITLEWVLKDELGVRGPFVALGRPAEDIPPEGAAREYVPNEVWEGRVTDLLSKAGLVVAIVGDTRGFDWEVEWLDKHDHLDGVVFVVPPVEGPVRRKLWRHLKEMLSPGISKALPEEEDLVNALVVYCDQRGKWSALSSNRPISEQAYREVVDSLRGILPPAEQAASSIVVTPEAGEGHLSHGGPVNTASMKQLYTPPQMLWASLLGFPMSGALLMALNWRTCDRRMRSVLTCASGMVLTALLITSLMFITYSVYFLLLVSVSFGVWLVAEEAQGTVIDRHVRSGGRVAPTWKALLLSLGVYGLIRVSAGLIGMLVSVSSTIF
jgi:hypothetical protein